MANRIPKAIPDTRANEVTAGMAVTGEANVGASVGVPVWFTDGRHYGMVAGLSHVPRRRFSHRGMRLLEVLGRFVGEELEQRELELRYELSPAEVQSVRETRRQQQVREIMSELCRYPAEGRLVTTPLHEIAAILSGRRAPETPRQALLTRLRTYLGSGAPTMRSSRH